MATADDKIAPCDTGDGGILAEFADVLTDPPKMREKCNTCKRPKTVCWCPYLPSKLPEIKANVFIFQHPFEESRRLQTSPMLYHGLPSGRCHIIKGKRFNVSKFPEISTLLNGNEKNSFLLYPGPNARDLADIAAERQKDSGEYTLILLDGTWAQARGIYAQNAFLQKFTQVQLTNTGLSEYVIRTQPTDGCLSTLETAALSISLMEGRPEISDMLIEPLRALCNFQLSHGAVEHQSKQYLIENGLYKKQTPKPPSGTRKHKKHLLQINAESNPEQIKHDKETDPYECKLVES